MNENYILIGGSIIVALILIFAIYKYVTRPKLVNIAPKKEEKATVPEKSKIVAEPEPAPAPAPIPAPISVPAPVPVPVPTPIVSADRINTTIIVTAPVMCADGSYADDLANCIEVDCGIDFLKKLPNGSACPTKTETYHSAVDTIFHYPLKYVTDGYVRAPELKFCPDLTEAYDLANCKKSEVDCGVDFLRKLPADSTCPEKDTSYYTDNDKILYYAQSHIDDGLVKSAEILSCPDSSTTYDLANCKEVDCGVDFLRKLPNGSICPEKNTRHDSNLDYIMYYDWEHIDSGLVKEPEQYRCSEGSWTFNLDICPVCPELYGKLIKLRYGESCDFSRPDNCGSGIEARYLMPFYSSSDGLVNPVISSVVTLAERDAIATQPGNDSLSDQFVIEFMYKDSNTGLDVVRIKSVGGSTNDLYLTYTENNFIANNDTDKDYWTMNNFTMATFKPLDSDSADKFLFFMYRAPITEYRNRCSIMLSPIIDPYRYLKQDDGYDDQKSRMDFPNTSLPSRFGIVDKTPQIEDPVAMRLYGWRDWRVEFVDVGSS